jgi:hypothetical protein
MEGKKTTWNIARERLRSGHNVGPGLLAPQVPLRDIFKNLEILRVEARVLKTRARPE